MPQHYSLQTHYSMDPRIFLWLPKVFKTHNMQNARDIQWEGQTMRSLTVTSNSELPRKSPAPAPLCAPVWVFALLSSSLSVWQLWDTAIGDTRKNILNKTCFSHLWVCTEHTGWVLNNGVMMPVLKHTQSWPKLSGMSGKNTDTAAATFCRSQAWYLCTFPTGGAESIYSWLCRGRAIKRRSVQCALITSNKPWEAISRHQGLGALNETFPPPPLCPPQPRVSARTLSWVHLSAGTELDYDGSSLFINATITLLNLQHNTLIGNLKLRSNISHAKGKIRCGSETINDK